MTRFVNRVYVNTLTTGQGATITLESVPFAPQFLNMVNGGAVDGQLYSYIIEEGSDFEIQKDQTWNSSTRELSRGTPVISVVGGSASTTKMNLTGNAAVRVTPLASDFQDIVDSIVEANANAIAMAIALG